MLRAVETIGEHPNWQESYPVIANRLDEIKEKHERRDLIFRRFVKGLPVPTKVKE